MRELRNVVDTAVVLSTSGRITRSQVASQLEAEPSPTSSLLPVPVGWTGDTGEREMIYASILALHRDVREILSLLRGQLDSGPLHSMREVFPEGQDGPAAVHDLASLERAAIVDALKASDGNRRKASEMLGISERTLYRKIKEYGLL